MATDHSKFPNADGDYTPAQRRITDARLDKADDDGKRGRTYGPFDTAEEMAASIETNIKKLRATKRKAKPAYPQGFLQAGGFLLANLDHPSPHAKKYNEAEEKWQARVNRSWHRLP